MTQHIELGKRGEELAQKMLREKGYEIVETNWRFDKDEIDIVAREGNELIIVEVKTRSTDLYGHPEDAVDQQKENFLIRATESYLETRFDIVAIILNKKETKIHHIIDAFYPE